MIGVEAREVEAVAVAAAQAAAVAAEAGKECSLEPLPCTLPGKRGRGWRCVQLSRRCSRGMDSLPSFGKLREAVFEPAPVSRL